MIDSNENVTKGASGISQRNENRTGTRVAAQGSPCSIKMPINHSEDLGNRSSRAETLGQQHILPAPKDSLSEEEPTKTSKKQGNWQPGPLSFFGWARAGKKDSVQKVSTSTAPQNINAHGYLPSFDGPGDTENDVSAKKDSEQRNPNTSSGPIQEAMSWNQKLQRKEPNAMDVRAFFRRLREEEKEMIRSKKEVRPFG